MWDRPRGGFARIACRNIELWRRPAQQRRRAGGSIARPGNRGSRVRRFPHRRQAGRWRTRGRRGGRPVVRPEGERQPGGAARRPRHQRPGVTGRGRLFQAGRDQPLGGPGIGAGVGVRPAARCHRERRGRDQRLQGGGGGRMLAARLHQHWGRPVRRAGVPAVRRGPPDSPYQPLRVEQVDAGAVPAHPAA